MKINILACKAGKIKYFSAIIKYSPIGFVIELCSEIMNPAIDLPTLVRITNGIGGSLEGIEYPGNSELHMASLVRYAFPLAKTVYAKDNGIYSQPPNPPFQKVDVDNRGLQIKRTNTKLNSDNIKALGSSAINNFFDMKFEVRPNYNLLLYYMLFGFYTQSRSVAEGAFSKLLNALFGNLTIAEIKQINSILNMKGINRLLWSELIEQYPNKVIAIENECVIIKEDGALKVSLCCADFSPDNLDTLNTLLEVGRSSTA